MICCIILGNVWFFWVDDINLMFKSIKCFFEGYCLFILIWCVLLIECVDEFNCVVLILSEIGFMVKFWCFVL